MNSWLEQEGTSIISVQRDYENNIVKITQNSSVNPINKWYVPLSFTSSNKLNFNDTKPFTWLTPLDSEKMFSIESNASEWIIFNVQRTGIIIIFMK